MRPYLLIPILSFLLLISWRPIDKTWNTEKHKNYTLYYTSFDKNNKQEYIKLVDNGVHAVQVFFKSSYNKEFGVYIHPSRHSLDSVWQSDWKMPDFKSECWMVASGVATKLDVLSPKLWDKESCEHIYSESTHTQQLITHELFHIYHGQLNSSPDFSNAEGIDWFVEGLATYASGQCDTVRITEVKKAIVNDKIPTSLDNFWTGKIKYGLSGSMVMFIDSKYGRKKLFALLSFNKKSEILSYLKTTEPELLQEWKTYIQKLQ